tara:strand:- start:3600 stop:4037 length:438 start_codon:yes stop_codon:yes gene_type:complete
VKHLNEHLRRANKKVALSKAQLEKGMVIEMMYKPIKGNLKRYVLTVLNANYQGKMHAVSMENVSHNAYTDFVDDVGIRYIPRFQKYRGVNISKVVMDVSSRRFYIGKLKNNLQDCYRTFDVKKINSLRLIDYNFDEKLIKKFLSI